MNYPHSEKYNTPELMAKIMGPNPLKLAEELLQDCRIPAGADCLRFGQRPGPDERFPCEGIRLQGVRIRFLEHAGRAHRIFPLDGPFGRTDSAR